MWVGFVFFFKQKPEYEMRISDWSSDVCSSDRDHGSGRHPGARLPGPDPCRDARSCPRAYDGAGRRQSYGMGVVSVRARSWTRGEMADNRDASSGASRGFQGEFWSLFTIFDRRSVVLGERSSVGVYLDDQRILPK